MKAVINEYPIRRKKILLSNIDEGSWADTRVRIFFEKNLKWVVKYGAFGYLTPQELRAIADKLEKYNKSKSYE